MHPAPRPVDVHVPPPLRFLSPTKLRTYATCPLQYRHRYVDRLQSPYTPASLIGQAIHETLESNFRAKKHTRRDLPLAEAREVFDRVWERHAPGPESAADIDDPWETAYADGLRALEHYLTQAAVVIGAAPCRASIPVHSAKRAMARRRHGRSGGSQRYGH